MSWLTNGTNRQLFTVAIFFSLLYVLLAHLQPGWKGGL